MDFVLFISICAVSGASLSILANHIYKKEHGESLSLWNIFSLMISFSFVIFSAYGSADAIEKTNNAVVQLNLGFIETINFFIVSGGLLVGMFIIGIFGLWDFIWKYYSQ